MRVIHVLDHSAPLQTSYAARTLAILRGLRSLGWETFQITGPKQGPGAAREEHVDGWTFHRCPPPGGILEGVPVLGEIELMGEITYRIEQVARRVRPHLLHAHSPVLNALPALRVARRLGIPMLYEVRSLWEDAAVGRGAEPEGGLRYRASRAVETWTLRRADAVVTICDGLRRELMARRIGEGKLTVIPHAAQVGGAADEQGAVEIRRTLGLEGAFVLGFSGPLYAHEGGDLLIQALPRLLSMNQRVRALFLGTGPEEAALKKLAAQLGVSGQVVFAGEVPESEIPRYASAWDIALFPRRRARLTELVTPVKVLEAMARGELVVASDVGGHRELIRHEETGILFQADSQAALVEAIAGLIGSPERGIRVKAAARRYIESERSWEANARAYEAVYARLVGAATRA